MTQRQARAWTPERHAVALNLTVDALTGKVVTALRDAGVPSLLLKGPVIARRLFQRGEIRPYADCDLLVRAGDLEVAEAAVARLGMVREPTHARLPEWERHASTWLLPARKFELDLHWTLVHAGAEPDAVWEVCTRDATAMLIGGVDVSTPADPQLAVIVALHAAQHGGDWSRPQDDLVRALDVFSQDVWIAAAQVAAALNARAAFTAGLRLVPSGLAMARALALPDESSFEVLLSTGRAGQEARALDRFIRAPGLLAKAQVAVGTAFPSAAHMRATRRLAARSRIGLVLAYVMQPAHVVSRLGRSLRHWRRARRESATSTGRRGPGCGSP